MTKQDTTVDISVGMTYPGILGQYSSMHIQVGMKIPSDTSVIDDMAKLKTVLDPYKDLVAEYAMANINEACEQVGKEKPFPGI